MKLRELLARLADHQVRFSVIGGVALMLVLTLEGLELAKRAAGRPKDLVDLGYIRALKG
jgi:hypothetical protein